VATAVPVTAITLRSMEARRYQDTPGQQVRVDHNSNISLVAKEADDRMRVEFSYTTSYGPLGVIKLEGALQFQDAGAGAAAESWGQSRILPPEMAQAVHGAVLSTCIPEAVGLAKTLRMPPPIPLPQVQMQAKPAPAKDSYGSPETT